MPSLTLIVPFGGIRSVDSGVLVVSGTVPVPVARLGAELLEEVEALDEPDVPDEEDDDELELPDDDEVELPVVDCNAL